MSTSFPPAQNADLLRSAYDVQYSSNDLPTAGYQNRAFVSLWRQLSDGGATGEPESSAAIKELYRGLYFDKGQAISSFIGTASGTVGPDKCAVRDGPKAFTETRYWKAWEEFDRRKKEAEASEKGLAKIEKEKRTEKGKKREFEPPILDSISREPQA